METDTPITTRTQTPAVGRDLAAQQDPDGPLFERRADGGGNGQRKETPQNAPQDGGTAVKITLPNAPPSGGTGVRKRRSDYCRRMTDAEIMTVMREASGLAQKDLAALTVHSTFVFYAIEHGRRIRTDTQREVWEKLGMQIGRFTRAWAKGHEQGLADARKSAGDDQAVVFREGYEKGRRQGRADVYNACEPSKLDPNFRISPAVQAEIRAHVAEVRRTLTERHNAEMAALEDIVTERWSAVWWKPWTWGWRRWVDRLLDAIEDCEWVEAERAEAPAVAPAANAGTSGPERMEDQA